MVIWNKHSDARTHVGIDIHDLRFSGAGRNFILAPAWRSEVGDVRVVQVALALAPRSPASAPSAQVAPLVDEVTLSPTAGYRDNPRREPTIEPSRPRARHRRSFALAAAAALVAFASCTDAVIPSPSAPGYVCGVMGISCGNGMCCGRDQTCGIPGTASEGMCRFSGEGMMGASYRGPAMTRQWPPHSSSAIP